MADDNWDINDFDVPDEVAQPQSEELQGVQETGTPAGTTDVKPVKLSRGKTGLLIVAVLIMLALILITIKGCNLEKTSNKRPNQGSANTAVTTAQISAENSGDIGNDNSENAPVFPSVDSTSAENPTTGNVVTDQPEVSQGNSQGGNSGGNNNSQPSENPGSNADTKDVLVEVPAPALSEEISTTGIVVGKHSYSFNGSYIYGVHISIIYGDATKSVYYFCPKKTFDALNSTDTLTVRYALDSAGNVSISSISK